MPIRREDAKRALELLEDYYGRIKPEDVALRASMEKVIQTFHSRLFNALLDIQEYYEITLLDDRRSDTSRRDAEVAASRMADRKTPVNFVQNDYRNNNASPHVHPHPHPHSEEPLPPPPPELMRDSYMSGRTQASPEPQAPMEYDHENWEYHEVKLDKGTSGMGFSISGGTDNPHVGNDPSIFITKLTEGGLAARDGRLRVNDVILSVNGNSMVNVSHAQSVSILKNTGSVVTLVVKRPKAASESIFEVLLKKGPGGLGFSIGGGVDNQHYVGDNAIYITKIIEGGSAEQDGRIHVGDKIIAVNDTYLHDVTHEEAVGALKATKERVRFVIGKATDTSNKESPKRAVPREESKPEVKQQQQQPAPVAQPQDEEMPEATYAAVKKAPKKKPKPAVPSKPSDKNGPRKIVLKKGSTGLGFNIVGGEDGEGIFVSLIQAGGPADLSGQLKKGDQLLLVNGIDLRDATHEQAAAVLKSSGETVEITAQYRPEEYEHFEAKIHDLREAMMNTTGGGLASGTSSVASSFRERRDPVPPKVPFFVKALFDFEPEDDSNFPGEILTFRYGDVMEVTSASDNDWWKAKKILPDEDESGIIPSKSKLSFNLSTPAVYTYIQAEEMETEKRQKSKPKKKKKSKKKGDEETSDDEGLRKILTYDFVVNKKLKYARPVLILGPLKDRLNDDLLTDFADRFGTCIPHTTRPRRADEVDGQDYHFVSSREQMEKDIENRLYVEAGQFSGNLYGTHVQSVIEVAKTGKHCILDVSGNAIKRLEEANLYPITIFVKADNADMIREWDDEQTPEQVQKAFEKMKKIEEEFGDQFSATVGGDSADEVYAQVKDVIREQSGPVVWISSEN